ncbi:MAG: TadE/TadG family type IV pilus assembly protein, partial [Acidimicrobiia bacterium]
MTDNRSETLESDARARFGLGSLRARLDAGSTLVEAAVVLPVILLVVLGTIEIGMAFKDYLTVGALSREGARVAAVAGNDL